MKKLLAASVLVGALSLGGVGLTAGVGHAPKWRVVRCHVVLKPKRHIVCTTVSAD